MVTLIKENKIVVCDDKDKNIYIRAGYEVVNKKTPAATKTAAEKKDDGKAKDDGKKLEGDLENL